MKMTNIKEALISSKVPKIAKLFASSEYKLRNKAYKIVLKLLKSKSLGDGQGKVSQPELIAICKGLHYWLWMQDKALLHEEIVEKICNLLTEISSKDVLQAFISTMIETEYREWDTLDKHRIDKFMMLVRDFFSAILKSVKISNYEDTAWLLEILSKYLINADNEKSVGLKFHFAFLVVDELKKAMPPQKFVEGIIDLYIGVMATIKPKVPFAKRIRQSVFVNLFNLLDEGTDLVNLTRMGQYVFDLGAKKETKPSNRKILYSLSEEFRKRELKKNIEEQESESQPEAMDTSPIVESPKPISPTPVNAPAISDKDYTLQNKKGTQKRIKSPKAKNAKIDNSTKSGDSDLLSLVNRITKSDAKSVSNTPVSKPTVTQSSECNERKRVSFGKIFRKPFTKRDTVATPSPTTLKVTKAPDKGILKPKRLSFSAPKSKKTKIRRSL